MQGTSLCSVSVSCLSAAPSFLAPLTPFFGPRRKLSQKPTLPLGSQCLPWEPLLGGVSVSHSRVSPLPPTLEGRGAQGSPEARGEGVDFWPVSFIPSISSTAAVRAWLIPLTDLRGSEETRGEGRRQTRAGPGPRKRPRLQPASLSFPSLPEPPSLAKAPSDPPGPSPSPSLGPRAPPGACVPPCRWLWRSSASSSQPWGC